MVNLAISPPGDRPAPTPETLSWPWAQELAAVRRDRRGLPRRERAGLSWPSTPPLRRGPGVLSGCPDGKPPHRHHYPIMDAVGRPVDCGVWLARPEPITHFRGPWHRILVSTPALSWNRECRRSGLVIM